MTGMDALLLAAALAAAAPSGAAPALDGLGAWTSVVRLDLAVGETALVAAPPGWRLVGSETSIRVVPEAGGAVVEALLPGAARVRLAAAAEGVEVEARVRPAAAAPARSEPRGAEAGAATGAPPRRPPVSPPSPPSLPSPSLSPPASSAAPLDAAVAAALPVDLRRYLRPPGAAVPAPREETAPAPPPPPWVREREAPDAGGPGSSPEAEGAARPHPRRGDREAAVHLPAGLLDRLAPALEEFEGREAPRNLTARPNVRADLEAALDLLDLRLLDAGRAALESAARNAPKDVVEAASYKSAEAALLRALRREAEAESAAALRRDAAAEAARRGAAADAAAAADSLAAHLEAHSDGVYAPAAAYALGRARATADRVAWATAEAPAAAAGAVAAYLRVARHHPGSTVADDAGLALATYYHRLSEAQAERAGPEAAVEARARAEAEYRAVLERYGGRPVADDALWGLARLLDWGAGDRVAAAEIYAGLFETHPESPYAAAARGRLTHLRSHYIDGRTPRRIR